MPTRVLLRSLLSSVNQNLIPRSLTNSSYILRFRPIVAIAGANIRQPSIAATDLRAFSTRRTTSSLNDSNPNWSNRPPKETILLDGCDFEHWLVVMDKPEGEPTRDEIIESYINTLAKILNSYEEAKMKIYSVSTRCYYAFGALVSEELSYKLKELPGVRWVLPDSYLDVKNKDYGGEPFIDGKAVPYDPKYHEVWISNNAKAKKNNVNKRPRVDRIRRGGEDMPSNRRPNNISGPPSYINGPPPHNMSGPPPNNMRGPMPPNNMNGPPPNNMNGPPPNNMNSPPPNNMRGPPPYNMNNLPPNNMNGPPPNNMSSQPNNWNGPPQPPYNAAPPNNMRGPMPPNNMRGPPPYNMSGQPNNWNAPPQPAYNGGPPPNNMQRPMPQNIGGGMPNTAPNYQQQQGRYGPNNGGPSYPNAYPPNTGGGNAYQTRDLPGRDMPLQANYE